MKIGNASNSRQMASQTIASQEHEEKRVSRSKQQPAKNGPTEQYVDLCILEEETYRDYSKNQQAKTNPANPSSQMVFNARQDMNPKELRDTLSLLLHFTQSTIEESTWLSPKQILPMFHMARNTVDSMSDGTERPFSLGHPFWWDQKKDLCLKLAANQTGGQSSHNFVRVAFEKCMSGLEQSGKYFHEYGETEAKKLQSELKEIISTLTNGYVVDRKSGPSYWAQPADFLLFRFVFEGDRDSAIDFARDLKKRDLLQFLNGRHKDAICKIPDVFDWQGLMARWS